jgi:hypothetical protein
MGPLWAISRHPHVDADSVKSTQQRLRCLYLTG